MAAASSGNEAPSRSAADWVADLCVYAPIGFLLDAHRYVPEFAEKGRNQVAMARFIGSFAVGRIEKRLGPLLEGAGAPVRALLDGLGLRVPPAVPVDGEPPAASAPATQATQAEQAEVAESTAAAPSAGRGEQAAAADHGLPSEPPAAAAAAAVNGASELSTPPAPPSARRDEGVGRKAGARTSRRTPARAPRGSRAVARSAEAAAADAVAAATDGTSGTAEAAPTEADLAIPQYSTLAASQVVPRLASLDVHELAAIRRFESDHRGRRTILNRVDQLLARTG